MKYYLLTILICIFQIDEVKHFSSSLQITFLYLPFLIKLSFIHFKNWDTNHLSVKYVANSFSWSIALLPNSVTDAVFQTLALFVTGNRK